MPTDTELLDWLEKQRTDYGVGIVFRQSTTGRGWRLHETDNDWKWLTKNEPQPTVREAIAYAMENE